MWRGDKPSPGVDDVLFLNSIFIGVLQQVTVAAEELAIGGWVHRDLVTIFHTPDLDKNKKNTCSHASNHSQDCHKSKTRWRKFGQQLKTWQKPGVRRSRHPPCRVVPPWRCSHGVWRHWRAPVAPWQSSQWCRGQWDRWSRPCPTSWRRAVWRGWSRCPTAWSPPGGGWAKVTHSRRKSAGAVEQKCILFLCNLWTYISVLAVPLLFDEGLRSLNCLCSLLLFGSHSLETRVNKDIHLTTIGVINQSQASLFAAKYTQTRWGLNWGGTLSPSKYLSRQKSFYQIHHPGCSIHLARACSAWRESYQQPRTPPWCHWHQKPSR